MAVSFAGPIFPVSTGIVGTRVVATILHVLLLASGTGKLVLDRIEDEVSTAEGPVIGVRNAISMVALPRRTPSDRPP
ncbi:hypothetical protein MES4922_40016 [Mesorhizobium ventifaucium]|uniref:Uncharacterized protein n=1 Tax=Mesorhizobium ventifaucium TaxID=666020 RepID=A0ABN8K409_9HYPH|nr:hypothetical protein MES4922_40016 [Mesorhizobium ventifaucium]